MFENNTLLITGGTGTFGNAVLQRLFGTNIGEIRIFSRDEKKQDEMRRAFADPKLKFYLGDVRNPDSLDDAMAGVDFIFHASALKQVPSCEFFPIEALRTNSLGTYNVVVRATAACVKRVIVLSTDKAVYPINAMGISKAMMEKIAIAQSRVAGEKTIICVTRYGNVMASRGSAIPLFVDQIQTGRPITITDPSMTRFMMTIEGAVDLVLHAFAHGRPGDIFVQKAPAATIDTLAKALIKLLNPQTPIQIIGTRHGEKLHETLLTREEMAGAEDTGEFFRVPSDNRDLNYATFFSEGREKVALYEDYTSYNTRHLDVPAMMEMLLSLGCVQQAMRGERIKL